MAHDDNNNPDHGEFDTKDVAPPGQLEYSKKFVYTEGQYQTKPKIALGFSLIDLDTTGKDSIRVLAECQQNTDTDFNIKVCTWNVSKINRTRSTWIEHKPTTKDICSGVWGPETTKWKGAKSAFVKFPIKYDPNDLPEVVVWFYKLDLLWASSWRCSAWADNITHEGFKINMETWSDTVVWDAQVSWIAVKKSNKHIHTGRFNSPEMRGSYQGDPHKVLRKVFPTGKFDKPPIIRIGISMVDLPSTQSAKLETWAEEITKEAFTWKLAHGSSYMNNAEYIAIAQ